MCIRFIHGATEVIGVEGHGYVNGGGGRGTAILVVAEGGGLSEEREFSGRIARLSIII